MDIDGFFNNDLSLGLDTRDSISFDRDVSPLRPQATEAPTMSNDSLSFGDMFTNTAYTESLDFLGGLESALLGARNNEFLLNLESQINNAILGNSFGRLKTLAGGFSY